MTWAASPWGARPWADGPAAAVVAPPPPPPPPETSSNQGAGGSRKSRRQRKPVVIEIDGKDIVVETLEEAEELVEKIKASAQELADQALQRAAAVQRRPRRKVLQDARKTLVLPSIEVDGDALMADLMRVAVSDVKSLFESTMRAIEIGALMRQQEQQLEEDDEDVLMLLL